MTNHPLSHSLTALTPNLKERLVDTLVNLIKIDSRSAISNTQHILEYLKKAARQNGLDSIIAGPEKGPKSLMINIKGRGNRKEGLILLSHLDTADWEEESWHYHPLSATQTAEGRIYGRGAIDCKSLAAIWLQLCIEFANSGNMPDRDICFIATSDEETGTGEGINWVLENTDVTSRCNAALNEGGGHICTSGDNRQKIITCQYGEKGRIELQSDYYSNRNESIIYEKGLFGYLKHLVMTGRYKKAQKQFRSFFTKPDLIHCYFSTVKTENKKVILYIHPAANSRRLMSDFTRLEKTEPALSLHPKSPPGVSPLNTPLYRTIEVCSRKAGFARVFPSVTRGNCENRFLRQKGIVTYGFFPVGLRENIAAMHGHNEYIHQKSLFDAYQLLFTIVRSYCFHSQP